MKFTREGQSFIYYSFDLGKKLAEITFPCLEEGIWTIDHTWVDESLRGKSVGARLVETVVEAARAEGFKVKPVCPYAVKWFEDNRDKIADIIA